MANPKRGISSKAAINQVKVDSLPYFYFRSSEDIIPYGTDNLYPNRIVDAIKKSPTAKGCVKKQSEFIFGKGTGTDIVVNRHGETLDDVVKQSIDHGYSNLGGFGIHMNFNLLGQITEMFFVSMEFIRKQKTMQKVEYSVWDTIRTNIYLTESEEIYLYDPDKFLHQVKESGGFAKYKGACKIMNSDLGLYPVSPVDSASISASFEKEAQIYPYANIRNGFSNNTLIKLPTLADGKEADEIVSDFEEKIRSMHGADKAGSSIVTTVPANATGETSPFQMIENMTPTNVDEMFINQNAKAEADILKCYNMPAELIGIQKKGGVFNGQAYKEAYNMKILDSISMQNEVVSFYNKLLPRSVFGIDSISLTPLDPM